MTRNGDVVIRSPIIVIVVIPMKNEIFAVRNPVSITAKSRSSINDTSIRTLQKSH
jgi:hypothetical protein